MIAYPDATFSMGDWEEQLQRMRYLSGISSPEKVNFEEICLSKPWANE